MISLSKKTDYGLLALSHLARLEPGKAASAREIAQEYAIPAELLAKILQQLARARIAASIAGPTGGYRLALPPKSISVTAIIEAIEGAPAFTQCMKTANNGCDQHDRCTIRQPLARIHSRILQMLSTVTLAELIEEEEASHSYPMLYLKQNAHRTAVQTEQNPSSAPVQIYE